MKMYNEEQLKQLAQILSECKDNSEDPLKILSSDISTEILEELSISYVKQDEGILIDLSIQKCKIYKTKKDLITYFDYSSNSVVVLEDRLIYIGQVSIPAFFENLIFSKKLQELMIEKEIISYRDNANKKYIFLSENIGKVEVGYKNKLLEFFDGMYAFPDLYNKIKDKFQESEYLSFFRDNFIKIAKDIPNIDDRFYKTLINIPNIMDNANREFELYKNKFSFEQFHSDLKQEKEKYIKNIQENLSEFLSKVNALPVQFGVYILLVFRFQNEIIPLIATVVLIISWSSFSFFSLSTMRKTVDFIERKFNIAFDKISEESGIDKAVLTQDRQEVSDKISDIKKMICWYKSIVVVFSLIFIAFSGSNIYKEYTAKVQYVEKNVSKNNITFDKTDSGLEHNITLNVKSHK